MKNEMIRTQYQEMDEAHHESQSIEAMGLSTTIMKNETIEIGLMAMAEAQFEL